MASLKQSLKMIGEGQPGKAIPRIPSGFHSSPKNLKAIMHAMNPPLIESWSLSHVDTFENLDWTEECQGLTTDGNFWYIVSNSANVIDELTGEVTKIYKGVYKFSLDFNLSGFAGYSQDNHVGAPGYSSGKIYIPVEGPRKVWTLNTSLVTQNIEPLGMKNGSFLQTAMPWCAINPWNGYLYSSNDNNVDSVFAYDPNSNPPFVYKGMLMLDGGKVNGVQSGVFSKNGHLYLSSDSTGDIRAYSALNGRFLGSCKVPYRPKYIDGAEEMEGLTLVHINHPDGATTYVHVVILDNDLTNRDDVILKNYAVPDPSVL